MNCIYVFYIPLALNIKHINNVKPKITSKIQMRRNPNNNSNTTSPPNTHVVMILYLLLSPVGCLQFPEHVKQHTELSYLITLHSQNKNLNNNNNIAEHSYCFHCTDINQPIKSIKSTPSMKRNADIFLESLIQTLHVLNWKI